MGDALRRFNALPELCHKRQTDAVRAGVAGQSVASEIATGQDFDAGTLQQVLGEGFVPPPLLPRQPSSAPMKCQPSSVASGSGAERVKRTMVGRISAPLSDFFSKPALPSPSPSQRFFLLVESHV